jgi:hypothetical protein
MPLDADLRDLTNKTDDDLLDSLGQALLGDGLGVGPVDSYRARRFATKWLTDRRDEMRRNVCGQAIRQFIDNEAGVADRLTEIAVVADALAGVFGHPTANIVAVILARRGLAELCGSEAD